MKVSIQGIKGSFHHKVTAEYFSSFELNECSTFDKLVKSVINEDSDYGVMAIENSIAGSILPNYALIDEYDLSITGEYSLSIDHNLMCLSGQSINKIREVHSHPMALLQCTKFFTQYPNIKLIESEDTALFAKKISENQINGVGAIASKEAAEIYDLEILNSSIQILCLVVSVAAVNAHFNHEVNVAGMSTSRLKVDIDVNIDVDFDVGVDLDVKVHRRRRRC